MNKEVFVFKLLTNSIKNDTIHKHAINRGVAQLVVSELCVAGGKLSKASEAQKQGVAKRRPRSARNDYVSRVQPDRARLSAKALNQANLNNQINFEV